MSKILIYILPDLPYLLKPKNRFQTLISIARELIRRF